MNQHELNKQFLRADIELFLGRIKKAEIRKQAAENTIHNLNRMIKNKRRLLELE